MGKTKMDDAAAERIRRARGEKDGFTKRAADAARRNEQGPSHRASSSTTKSGNGHGKSGQKSGGGKK